MKIAAYLDNPIERTRDLDDLILMWQQYHIDSEGRFFEPVVNLGVPYDYAGAFLIGFELRPVIDPIEKDMVIRFFERVRDARDPDYILDRLVQRWPRGWPDAEDNVLKCVAAMEQGLIIDLK